MSEWICIEDRIPEEGEIVIAFGEYDGEINGLGGLMTGIGVWISGRVEMEADCYYANIVDVTHWMPAPNMPGNVEHKGGEG